MVAIGAIGTRLTRRARYRVARWCSGSRWAVGLRLQNRRASGCVQSLVGELRHRLERAGKRAATRDAAAVATRGFGAWRAGSLSEQAADMISASSPVAAPPR